MVATPASSKSRWFRVETVKPWVSAVAAIMLSLIGIDLPAARMSATSWAHRSPVAAQGGSAGTLGICQQARAVIPEIENSFMYAETIRTGRLRVHERESAEYLADAVVLGIAACMERLLTSLTVGRTLDVQNEELGMATTERRRRSRRMELRTTPHEREVIDRAVAFSQTDLTDFVVTTAVTAAQQILADGSHFELDRDAAAAWEEINARAPRDLPGLRRLMARPSPFGE